MAVFCVVIASQGFLHRGTFVFCVETRKVQVDYFQTHGGIPVHVKCPLARRSKIATLHCCCPGQDEADAGIQTPHPAVTAATSYEIE